MKLTVMMLLASSYKEYSNNNQRTQQSANSLPDPIENASGIVDSEEQRDYWRLLDHLEEAQIEPSGTNRTSKSSIW